MLNLRHLRGLRGNRLTLITQSYYKRFSWDQIAFDRPWRPVAAAAAMHTVMEQITLTQEEQELFSLLLEAAKHAGTGTTLRCAGGWVRDKLLGKESKDIDVALDNMLGRDFADKARVRAPPPPPRAAARMCACFAASTSPCGGCVCSCHSGRACSETARFEVAPPRQRYRAPPPGAQVNEYLQSQGRATHRAAVIHSNPEQSKHLETARMKARRRRLRSSSSSSSCRKPLPACLAAHVL